MAMQKWTCSVLAESLILFWLGMCPKDNDFENVVASSVASGHLSRILPCVRGVDHIVAFFESVVRQDTHIVIFDDNIQGVPF